VGGPHANSGRCIGTIVHASGMLSRPDQARHPGTGLPRPRPALVAAEARVAAALTESAKVAGATYGIVSVFASLLPLAGSGPLLPGSARGHHRDRGLA
jgi:hypothetical protein